MLVFALNVESNGGVKFLVSDSDTHEYGDQLTYTRPDFISLYKFLLPFEGIVWSCGISVPPESITSS